MEIQEFLTQTTKGIIPIAALTTIAANRAAHGDDVAAAFTTQIEQRSAQAQTVLDAASQAGRDTLLASEQRSYDGAVRERDSILGLLRQIEQRTAQKNYVPATQSTTETRTDDAIGPVLTKEQRCSTWLQQRGGYAYAAEPGPMRFGAVVRALALGDRRGLSQGEQRALSEGTDSAGGYTVPEILASSFIDRMRNQMVVQRAGAVTVPMSSDTLHIARLAQPGVTAGGSPLVNGLNGAWKTENADIDMGDLVLERVTFTARTLAFLVKMSVELSEDSLNIDQIIEGELAKAAALEVDRAALLGTGVAPQPRGIKFQSGVQTGTLGSPAGWDFLVDGAAELWQENHEPNAVIWSPTFAKTAAKFKDQEDQPLRMPQAIEGIRQFRTNQVDPDDVIVGDFTQLMIGVRTSFRLEVSRVAGTSFEKLQVWVRCYLRADVQLAHPEAFILLQ